MCCSNLNSLIFTALISVVTLNINAVMATDIKFSGRVSVGTCHILTLIDGQSADDISSPSSGIANLGDTIINEMGPKVTIVFKPKDPEENGCALLINSSKESQVSWFGNMKSHGIVNAGGSAKDSYVVLMPVNSDNNIQITSRNSRAYFKNELLATDGFIFTAQMHGGNIPGIFRSASAYAVSLIYQ